MKYLLLHYLYVIPTTTLPIWNTHYYITHMKYPLLHYPYEIPTTALPICNTHYYITHMKYPLLHYPYEIPTIALCKPKSNIQNSWRVFHEVPSRSWFRRISMICRSRGEPESTQNATTERTSRRQRPFCATGNHLKSSRLTKSNRYDNEGQ